MQVRIGQLAATVTAVDTPQKALDELPPVGFTPAILEEPQPSLTVGVHGGAAGGHGRVMCDTGAAFTLMSDAVARLFGL